MIGKKKSSRVQPSQGNPLPGGVAQSAGAVLFPAPKNLPQGLTALAPPERGFIRLRRAAMRPENSCTRRFLR